MTKGDESEKHKIISSNNFLVSPQVLAESSDKQMAAILSGFDYLLLDLRGNQTLPNKSVAEAFLPYLVS